MLEEQVPRASGAAAASKKRGLGVTVTLHITQRRGIGVIFLTSGAGDLVAIIVIINQHQGHVEAPGKP